MPTNRIPQLPAPPKPRKRKANRTAIKATAIIGLSLISGLAFQAPPTEPALAAGAQPPAIIYEAAIPTRHPYYLESVDLPDYVQETIWSICHEDPRLYCTVMAIANRETRFRPHAIGDNGNSIGLLQIQPRWHQERMNDLGITDLMDPAQNVTVAVDYLGWIAERLNPERPEEAYGTHALLMAYNQGWAGARKSWDKGIHSSRYSREVMRDFTAYMAELGVTP